jgi:hypothetical protein
MKLKFFIGIGLFAVIIFASCKQSVEKPVLKETNDVVANMRAIMTDPELVNSVTFNEMNSYSLNFKKQVYNHLTAANKARVWHERFAFLKAKTKDEVLKTAIDEIDVLATENLFLSAVNIEPKVDEFMRRYIPTLGYETCKILLTTMDSDTKINLPVPNPGPTYPPPTGPQPQCSCSSGDDWCGSSTTCSHIICKESSGGCGFFWSWPCDGRCKSHAF